DGLAYSGVEVLQCCGKKGAQSISLRALRDAIRCAPSRKTTCTPLFPATLQHCHPDWTQPPSLPLVMLNSNRCRPTCNTEIAFLPVDRAERLNADIQLLGQFLDGGQHASAVLPAEFAHLQRRQLPSFPRVVVVYEADLQRWP